MEWETNRKMTENSANCELLKLLFCFLFQAIRGQLKRRQNTPSNESVALFVLFLELEEYSILLQNCKGEKS